MTLHDLAALIEEECRSAREQGLFGTDDLHVERFERLPNRDGAPLFRVTIWNEQSVGPRKHREMGMLDLMGFLGRVIGHRAASAATERTAGGR